MSEPQPPAYPAWTPYPGAPPPPLPWYRTTKAIVLGGIACLVVGGVLGAIAAFAGLAVVGLTGAFDPDVTTYGAGGDLAAFAIGGGQCATTGIDDVGGAGYAEGSGIPCDQPHGIEHYATAEVPTPDEAGGGFDRSDLATFADSACDATFQPYVGHGSTTSAYDYRAVMPSEAAWEDGTRTIHCVLWIADGEPDRGSARNSRR